MNRDQKTAAYAQTNGITILEIIFGLLIISLLAAFSTRFLFRGPIDRRQEFIAQLNGVIRDAWLNVLKTDTVHRIKFDFEKKLVTVEKARQKGFIPFPAAASWVPARNRSVKIPGSTIFNAFIIEGKDVMGGGGKTIDAYFLIDHTGAFQDVKLVLGDGMHAPMSITYNPFLKLFRTETCGST